MLAWEAAPLPIWGWPLQAHFDQPFLFPWEGKLCALKAEIKVTISHREEEITENYTDTTFFFIQGNGPARKDTGEAEMTQKDKQTLERYFYIIKKGIRGKSFYFV